MQETTPEPTVPEQAAAAVAAPEAEPEAAPAAAPEAAAQTAPDAAPEAAPEMGPAACAAALAERFPALFAGPQPLPIKLRIQADIQERAPGVFTRKALSIFLHRHTTSTPYIRALLAAQTRFDLDGQPAGEIAAEHREAAVAELERRKAIVQARRQAERAAMKPPQGERPPRPPRPQQPPGAAGEARPERPPRAPREGRPDQPPRPPRFQRPPQAQQPHQARPPRPDRPPAEQRRPPPPREAEAALPALPPGPDAEARRSRALLLRAYETSTISRANFCALKGLTDAALEAQLQQARAERGEHAAPRAADRQRR